MALRNMKNCLILAKAESNYFLDPSRARPGYCPVSLLTMEVSRFKCHSSEWKLIGMAYPPASPDAGFLKTKHESVATLLRLCSNHERLMYSVTM
jgi:hypothetical protein